MSQNARKWLLIAVPVIVIVVAAYILWARNAGNKGLIQNLTNKQNATENQNNNINNGSMSGSGSQSDATAGSSQLSGPISNESSPDEKRSSEQSDEALRQQIIAYVNQNLNKLVTPPKNDEWDIPTFYFVGNSNVYVELYAVETDLAGLKLLYKAEKNNGGIKLTEIARYTEGEEDWILKTGKDDYSEYVIEEYDLNEDNNKWEKTDEFSGSDYSDEVDTSGDSGETLMP